MEDRVSGIEDRLKALEKRLDSLEAWVAGIWFEVVTLKEEVESLK